MSTIAAGRHARPPSLLAVWLWLVNQLDAWLLGGDPGRHERIEITKPVRAEFGADPAYGDTLHGWNAEDATRAAARAVIDDAPQSVADADTDHLYDLLDSADLLAPLDAHYRAHADGLQARIDDATEVALTAASRRTQNDLIGGLR